MTRSNPAGPPGARSRGIERSPSAPSPQWVRVWHSLPLLTVWKVKIAADRARDARDWKVAAERYAQVLRRAPRLDGLRVQLAHMHKELGDYESAAMEYYSVLVRRPEDDDLHLQIGHLEKLRRQWPAAIYHYGEAARINPNNSDAMEEYQALGGALADKPYSTKEPSGSTSRRFSDVDRAFEHVNSWPLPDSAELPPMSTDAREIYAVITKGGKFA